jgi:hypothetical protein
MILLVMGSNTCMHNILMMYCSQATLQQQWIKDNKHATSCHLEEDFNYGWHSFFALFAFYFNFVNLMRLLQIKFESFSLKLVFFC